MSLSITITKKGKASIWNDNLGISFDGSDADYWYLHDSFTPKLKAKTGRYLDLYDDCSFEFKNLFILNDMLNEEIMRLQTNSLAVWKVHIGTQILPTKKEKYEMINKDLLLKKLFKFLEITLLAIETNEKIVALGD